jgi:hypothetical protein
MLVKRRFVQCDVFVAMPTRSNGPAVAVDAQRMSEENAVRTVSPTPNLKRSAQTHPYVRKERIVPHPLLRVGWLSLAAAITAALWAIIICFGSWLINLQIGIEVLLCVSGVIFFLALLCLGLVSLASDNCVSNDNNSGEAGVNLEEPAIAAASNQPASDTPT